MDKNRAAWNKNQHLLQAALAKPQAHSEWLSLFLTQHAQVHSGELGMVEGWSFADEVFAGLSDNALRLVPPGAEHSLLWIIWHLARCEDLTMNVLVAGTDQVFIRQGWKDRLHPPFDHTGNEIDVATLEEFSQVVDPATLQAYRLAVGASTRQVVGQLTPFELTQKVDPGRIMKVRQASVVLPAADVIVNYWSKRTIAGLLLMPPTRHCFTHLNEALRIRLALGVK